MRLAIWAGPRQRPSNSQAAFATGLGITTRRALAMQSAMEEFMHAFEGVANRKAKVVLIAQVPRGLARRVGVALAGSSGQGWRG